MKVLNIEDSATKHIAIKRALKENRISNVHHRSNAEDGIKSIVDALNKNEAFDLLVLDMHFPINGILNDNAGIIVLERLKKLDITLPIIICSSIRLNVSEVIGCIWYNQKTDLSYEFRNLLRQIN